jgi:hypothetical protein
MPVIIISNHVIIFLVITVAEKSCVRYIICIHIIAITSDALAACVALVELKNDSACMYSIDANPIFLTTTNGSGSHH